MHSSPTHWAMFFVGGLAFVAMGEINEIFTYEMPVLLQCFIGTIATTIIEFTSGCILNLWMGLHIWDYSAMPGNLLGQVCPQFMAAWFLIAGVAIVLDDYLRFWLFGEEKPHYVLWSKKRRRKTKIEFSKFLVTWALSLTSACVALSYILSWLDHDPCMDVTQSVVTTCIAIGVAYEAKSYGEKNSRNKYKVDIDPAQDKSAVG